MSRNYLIIKPDRDMLEKVLPWESINSPQITLRYPSNFSFSKSEASVVFRRIKNIFHEITELLSVKPDETIVIYICPTIQFCKKYTIPAPAAVPHAYFVTLIVNRNDLSLSDGQVEHELTHVIACFWDRKIYHLEILEEGLASVLCQEGQVHHLIYKNSFPGGILQPPEVKNILYVNCRRFTTDYKKAASFTKFIIDRYKINKFKELYLESSLECKGLVYYIDEQIQKRERLKQLINKILKVDPDMLARDWLETIGLKIQEPIHKFSGN